MYYSGQEIIAVALRIEENGHAFYTAAAGMSTGTSDTKNLFLDLAEKEIMHIAIFQKLADKFEPEDFEFDQDESSSYISHLADQHIFGKPGSGSELGAAVKSPKEALEIAFKFENDSVTFYEELEKRTKTESRKLIRQIIEEEKEHAAEIRQFM